MENEILVVSVSFSLFFGLIGDRSSFENHELNIQLRFVSLDVWNLCQHSLILSPFIFVHSSSFELSFIGCIAVGIVALASLMAYSVRQISKFFLSYFCRLSEILANGIHYNSS